MLHKPYRIGLVSGALVLAISSPLLVVYGGDDKKEEVPAATAKALESLQSLKWMHGEWVSKLGGDTLHETWSTPHGDSMMGMFRWIKGDKVWMFELITITADGDDVVFVGEVDAGLDPGQRPGKALRKLAGEGRQATTGQVRRRAKLCVAPRRNRGGDTLCLDK